MNHTPYRASPTQGLKNEPLSRTNSLPLGIDTIDRPVQLRLPIPRAHRKAQNWRTSVATTSSDYYNQWRPQISPLVRVHSHGSGANVMGQSAASLDTISEYEMQELAGGESNDDSQFKSPLVQPHRSSHYRDSINADPSMFRYTPTPILDPQRQTVPTPLSRPTTPQIGSGGYNQNQPTLYLSSPPEGSSKVANSNFLKASSQAIHASAAANNQFLPLFLNPETGNVYMFEDGYYVPIPSKNVQELEKATNINANALTKAPTPDRRSITLPESPPDCSKFVVVLMILSCLFLNLPVLLLFLLPSLACSLKVRRHNSLGNAKEAKNCSEWVLCSSVSSLILLPATLVTAVTLLILTFATNVIMMEE